CIALRDGTCTMPGSHRTARTSHAAHPIPYAAGATTAHHNLATLGRAGPLPTTSANWTATQTPPRPGRFAGPSPLAYPPTVTTAHHNLGSLCQVCHLLNTFANWTVTQDPHRPGRFDWTSPLGYTHTVTPDPVGPIIQAEPLSGNADDDPADDIPPF